MLVIRNDDTNKYEEWESLWEDAPKTERIVSKRKKRSEYTNIHKTHRPERLEASKGQPTGGIGYDTI